MAYATDEQIELLLDTVDGGKPQTLRHLVEYAEEKAKEIHNKLANEGIAKIRTSWKNCSMMHKIFHDAKTKNFHDAKKIHDAKKFSMMQKKFP